MSPRVLPPMLAMTWRSIAGQSGKPGTVVFDDPAQAALDTVPTQHFQDHVPWR